MANNVVEYVVKLKDLASSSMAKFGQNSKVAFASASSMTQNLQVKNRLLGHSYKEIRSQIAQTAQQAKSSGIIAQIKQARMELSGLQRQAATSPLGRGVSKGAGALSAVGVGAGMLAAQLAMGVVSRIGSFASDTVSKGLERQQTMTSFDTLTGSPQKGSALVKELVDLQKNTILGSEVFKNAQTMLGYGFNADQVTQNLRMLGDVALGDTQRLASLTLAFSQIRATGKLMGQDLLQLVNAGFNPLEQISRSTGRSVSDLKADMSSGLISFEDVQKAFQDATAEGGRFENMLGKIAQTTAGKVQQLAGAWDELKVQAGLALAPLVSKSLEFGNYMLQLAQGTLPLLAGAVNKILEVITNIGSATGGFYDYLNIAGYAIKNIIIPYAKFLFSVIGDIVKQLVEFVKNSVLLKDIFSALIKITGWLTAILKGIIGAFKVLFDTVIMPILNAIEKAYRLIKGVKSVGSSGVAPRAVLTNGATVEVPVVGELPGIVNTSQLATTNQSTGRNLQSAINGGGQKTINITIGKFLDNININTTNIQEGAGEIEQVVLNALSRVLSQATTANAV